MNQKAIERIEVNLQGIEQAHEIYTGESCIHNDYVKGAIKRIREVLAENERKR